MEKVNLRKTRAVEMKLSELDYSDVFKLDENSSVLYIYLGYYDLPSYGDRIYLYSHGITAKIYVSQFEKWVLKIGYNA